MTAMNLAVIGYGGMGTYHVHGIIPKENQQITVTGIYDIAPQRQAAAQAKGLQVYPDLAALLKDQAVEAVLIATPNDSHKDLAIKALAAGKHVICEKPVAMNTQELDEITAAAAAYDRIFMVHQNRRWDPDFLIVQNLYQQQSIGELFQIESRVQGANGIPGDWRHLTKHGGGMLLDWGVHLFDQLLFLVDSPVINVMADLSYILGDEVDDGFICYLTFANGLRALVEVGTTNYSRLPRWYIKGLKGTGTIKDWDLSGELIAASEAAGVTEPTPIQAGVGLTKTMAPPSEAATVQRAFPKGQAAYPAFYQNFYQVIRQGAEPIVKNAEVRRVMQLIDQIFAAAQQQTGNSHL